MTEAKNPWLSHPSTPDPDTPVAIEEHVRPATGPVAPQRGVPAPDRADQLPLFDRRQNADVWWLGVHGGAGESSLSGVLPGSAAADHGWPQTPGEQPARVVLVARSNMRGLRAAQAAATQWASGLVPGVDVLGLVIVADAPGRIPRPLRDFAHLVGGGVPRTWTVPWIESWRLGEPPALSDAPREVRRLVDELHALVQSGADGTTN